VTTNGMGQLNAHPQIGDRHDPHASWRLDDPYLKFDGRMCVSVPSFCFNHDFHVSFSSGVKSYARCTL
jgi:hypothetical protein